MFFNMFLFSLIFFNALSDVGVALFEDALGFFGLSNIIAIELQLLPNWLEYIIIILVVDFVQWFTHILMHRWKFLWSFHKVHHSVKEMFCSTFASIDGKCGIQNQCIYSSLFYRIWCRRILFCACNYFSYRTSQSC